MGLRDNQIINSVHPWLGIRLKWLGEVARILGGGQSLISGNRTVSQQARLFDENPGRPVAEPGCSQHQYGFAADATWLPFVIITSKGRPLLTSQEQTNAIMSGHANRAQLTTVANDAGHVQIYPGAMFRSWASARGLCPDPGWWRMMQNRIANENLIGFQTELDILLDFATRRFIGR